METVKAQMDEEIAKKMRATAMQLYGHKKGAISNAITDAVKDWLAKLSRIRQNKTYKPNWGSLRGALSDIKMSSVELQHATTKMRMKER